MLAKIRHVQGTTSALMRFACSEKCLANIGEITRTGMVTNITLNTEEQPAASVTIQISSNPGFEVGDRVEMDSATGFIHKA